MDQPRSTPRSQVLDSREKILRTLKNDLKLSGIQTLPALGQLRQGTIESKMSWFKAKLSNRLVASIYTLWMREQAYLSRELSSGTVKRYFRYLGPFGFPPWRLKEMWDDCTTGSFFATEEAERKRIMSDYTSFVSKEMQKQASGKGKQSKKSKNSGKANTSQPLKASACPAPQIPTSVGDRGGNDTSLLSQPPLQPQTWAFGDTYKPSYGVQSYHDPGDWALSLPPADDHGHRTGAPPPFWVQPTYQGPCGDFQIGEIKHAISTVPENYIRKRPYEIEPPEGVVKKLKTGPAAYAEQPCRTLSPHKEVGGPFSSSFGLEPR